MELIVISDSKLKIMLTAPDMIRYDLEGSCKDCTDDKTRAAFRHIFDDARREIGFDTEGERLFVQMYASREGGCEIFVTKLGAEPLLWEDEIPLPTPVSIDEELSPGEKALLERICAKEESVFYGADTSASPSFALLLESMEALLGVCRALLGRRYRGGSRAYIEETDQGERWYLLLTPTGARRGALPRQYALAAEFGTETDAADAELYLSEHGRCVCPAGAVETLGRL